MDTPSTCPFVKAILIQRILILRPHRFKATCPLCMLVSFRFDSSHLINYTRLVCPLFETSTCHSFVFRHCAVSFFRLDSFDCLSTLSMNFCVALQWTLVKPPFPTSCNGLHVIHQFISLPVFTYNDFEPTPSSARHSLQTTTIAMRYRRAREKIKAVALYCLPLGLGHGLRTNECGCMRKTIVSCLASANRFSFHPLPPAGCPSQDSFLRFRQVGEAIAQVSVHPWTNIIMLEILIFSISSLLFVETFDKHKSPIRNPCFLSFPLRSLFCVRLA